MGFNLDDYEPVSERLRRVFKQGHEFTAPRIVTACLTPEDDLPHHAHYRAELYDGQELIATGEAYEEISQSGVNRTSHVENCETSAIGRALANCGHDGDRRPSREEMQKAAVSESEKAELDDILAIAKQQGTTNDVVAFLAEKRLGRETRYTVYKRLKKDEREALKGLAGGGDE